MFLQDGAALDLGIRSFIEGTLVIACLPWESVGLIPRVLHSGVELLANPCPHAS